MSGRLSLADLRRRRQAAGTADDGTPLLAPTTTTAQSAAGGTAVATNSTEKASAESAATWGHCAAGGKTGTALLDGYLDGGCQPRFENEVGVAKKFAAGRAVGSRWFESRSAPEKEELHADAIVHMHDLMNPNRRASRYYLTPDEKQKKRLEVDYLYEESGILQAIRRSGEARVYLWYALYFIIFRLWMSAFLLLVDAIMDPTAALRDCIWSIQSKQCGPQREGATYALWAYIANNSVAWVICTICTHLLPQYDERFNIFHVRITQLCMKALFLLGSLNLLFEYYTYNGSFLRRAYEMMNMALTVIVYILCKLSTWITAHETTALGESIVNQRDHTKRYNEMMDEWPNFLREKREAAEMEQKKKREEVFSPNLPTPNVKK